MALFTSQTNILKYTTATVKKQKAHTLMEVKSRKTALFLVIYYSSDKIIREESKKKLVNIAEI